MAASAYESRRLLQAYLLFHYGKPRQVCPFPFAPSEALRFHERIFSECLGPVRFRGPTRGLDLGCAVGRQTFELAQVVDRVIGVDLSRRFIGAARRMARDGRHRVEAVEEGDRTARFDLVLPPRLRRGAVEFRVGDAQQAAPGPDGPYQVVLAINLVCRLPRPRAFLRRLPALVAPGGRLVIGTPWTWLDEFTPRREWLGGRDAGSPPGAEALARLLRPHFRLVRRRDLPFLIPEHRRKYQWCVSEVSTFVRER